MKTHDGSYDGPPTEAVYIEKVTIEQTKTPPACRRPVRAAEVYSRSTCGSSMPDRGAPRVEHQRRRPDDRVQIDLRMRRQEDHGVDAGDRRGVGLTERSSSPAIVTAGTIRVVEGDARALARRAARARSTDGDSRRSSTPAL